MKMDNRKEMRKLHDNENNKSDNNYLDQADEELGKYLIVKYNICFDLANSDDEM